MRTKQEHFNSKWIPEPFSGCWLWTLRAVGNGYGVLHYDKKTDYAHRESWRLYHGEIPNGLFVLHRCDTPCCVNPDHLFLGSQKDNQHDCMAKGRKPIGVHHWHATLSENDVKEIRSSHLSSIKLSKIYPITARSIRRIKQGGRWRHLS